MRNPALVRASVRLYRLFLAVYPAEFRRAVGEDALGCP